MIEAAQLRRDAQLLGGGLPPLMAQAELLASNLLLGVHGRRRAGPGSEFWQYRQAMPGDEARAIDWRRSGRGDLHFVREREWQTAQTVTFWVDDARSMQFASDRNLATKHARAAVLALSLAILLMRGGERIALAGVEGPGRTGELQISRFAAILAEPAEGQDYGAPQAQLMPPHSRAVFVSDFLGDAASFTGALTRAADRGVKGLLMQVLDPAEESFPFDGRTIFESMGGTVRHETMKAADLRNRYLERLAERRALLGDLAARTGWLHLCHHTDQSAQVPLLWAYSALERRR